VKRRQKVVFGGLIRPKIPLTKGKERRKIKKKNRRKKAMFALLAFIMANLDSFWPKKPFVKKRSIWR